MKAEVKISAAGTNEQPLSTGCQKRTQGVLSLFFKWRHINMWPCTSCKMMSIEKFLNSNGVRAEREFITFKIKEAFMQSDIKLHMSVNNRMVCLFLQH